MQLEIFFVGGGGLNDVFNANRVQVGSGSRGWCDDDTVFMYLIGWTFVKYDQRFGVTRKSWCIV